MATPEEIIRKINELYEQTSSLIQALLDNFDDTKTTMSLSVRGTDGEPINRTIPTIASQVQAMQALITTAAEDWAADLAAKSIEWEAVKTEVRAVNLDDAFLSGRMF